MRATLHAAVATPHPDPVSRVATWRSPLLASAATQQVASGIVQVIAASQGTTARPASIVYPWRTAARASLPDR